MIKKAGNRKYIRNNRQKKIFTVLIIIYIAGILAGCVFSLKNSNNITFVKTITLTSNTESIRNNTISDRLKLFLSRDILCVLSALMLRHSGLLKGLCVCIPFIAAVQNSSVFITDYYSGSSISTIMTRYGLRCTASSFLIIMYCTVILGYILRNREGEREEAKVTAVYICGIILIYVIDVSIKLMLV